MSDRPARPTSHDVAQRAGVSQTTVSLVLRGAADGRISGETQSRVLQAAAELNYRPNEAGRSLRGNGSRLIAVAVPDITDPYFSAAMRGAESATRGSGAVLALVEIAGDDDIERLLDAVISGWVSGVLLCAPTAPVLARLTPVLGQIVVLDGFAEGAHACFEHDVASGIDQSVEHLRSLGHQRLGHVTSDTEAATVRLRREAFDVAVPDGPEFVLGYPINPDEAVHRLVSALSEHPAITGLVCDTDDLALAALAAAHDLGRSVPGELSVVGFNDTRTGRVARPPLTTVALQTEHAAALAAAAIAGPRRATPFRLATTLVVRGSTGPPAGH